MSYNRINEKYEKILTRFGINGRIESVTGLAVPVQEIGERDGGVTIYLNIDEIEEIEYEYKQQGELLHELLEKKEGYLKRERMITKAKEIARKNEKKEIEFDKKSLNDEYIFEAINKQ